MLRVQQSANIHAELALPSQAESLAYMAEVEKAAAIRRQRARTITMKVTRTSREIAGLWLIMVIMAFAFAVSTGEAVRRLVEIDQNIATAARV